MEPIDPRAEARGGCRVIFDAHGDLGNRESPADGTMRPLEREHLIVSVSVRRRFRSYGPFLSVSPPPHRAR